MDKLCEHLQKNPKSRQYVHDIEIAPYYWVENEDDREELDRSLTVLMTKNLRAIKGEDAYGSGVLKTLIQVLQRPTGKSVKLEQLPIGRNTSSKLVVPELLHHFRETLKSMEIRSEWGQHLQVEDSLGQLKSLTNLTIDYDIERFGDFKKLNALLSTCAHLKSIQFNIRCQRVPQRDVAGWNEWLSTEVSKVESVESVTVSYGFNNWFHMCNVDFLQYLLFKYPNLGDICLDRTVRIKEPIKDVETIRLEGWTFYNWEDVTQMVQAWKSKTNSVVIKYHDTTNKQHWKSLCTMHIVRSQQRNRTKITIEHIQRCTPLKVIKRILSLLGKSTVKDLEADLAGFFKFNQGRLSPSQLLPRLPLLESFKLTADNSSLEQDSLPPLTRDTSKVYCKQHQEQPEHPHQSPPNHHHCRLRTLELVDMDLEAHHFLYLAQLCPSLNQLWITTTLATALTRHTNRNYVHLPGIQLRTLAVKLTCPDTHSAGRRSPCTTTTKHALIRISTDNCHQDFFTRPNEPLLRLCDHDTYPQSQDSTLISIQCQSLGYLKVALDDIMLELRFNEEGKIEYSTPSIIDSDAMVLSEKLAFLENKYQTLEKRYALDRTYLSEAEIQEIDHELLNE